MTAGQRAYETELKARPTYDDGTPRRTWGALPEWARWTWERNPTPRWTLAALAVAALACGPAAAQDYHRPLYESGPYGTPPLMSPGAPYDGPYGVAPNYPPTYQQINPPSLPQTVGTPD